MVLRPKQRRTQMDLTADQWLTTDQGDDSATHGQVASSATIDLIRVRHIDICEVRRERDFYGRRHPVSFVIPRDHFAAISVPLFLCFFLRRERSKAGTGLLQATNAYLAIQLKVLFLFCFFTATRIIYLFWEMSWAGL